MMPTSTHWKMNALLTIIDIKKQIKHKKTVFNGEKTVVVKEHEKRNLTLQKTYNHNGLTRLNKKAPSGYGGVFCPIGML